MTYFVIIFVADVLATNQSAPGHQQLPCWLDYDADVAWSHMKLTYCGLVITYGVIDLGQHWPDSTKSLPEPMLTLKHREMHGCVVSTVDTDALVLKHQAISIHNAD